MFYILYAVIETIGDEIDFFAICLGQRLFYAGCRFLSQPVYRLLGRDYMFPVILFHTWDQPHHIRGTWDMAIHTAPTLRAWVSIWVARLMWRYWRGHIKYDREYDMYYFPKYVQKFHDWLLGAPVLDEFPEQCGYCMYETCDRCPLKPQ